MTIKNRVVRDVVAMSEDLASGYDKPGSPIRGVDLERFAGVFKGVSSRLRLKQRIKVVDAVRFCDALRKVIVLE